MGKLAISLALLAASALGASDQEAIQSTFLNPWVEALRSKDKARVERLLHPAVRACITPSTKEFFDTDFERQTDSVPSGGYHITKFAPITGAPPAFWPQDGFRYPVQPTYDVDVQFDQGDLIMVLFLAQSNGAWYEVGECPNEKGMAYFRQTLVDYAEAEKKAAQLAASLKDPLRSELRELLRQEQYGPVIQKIKDATGVDTGMAMRVMNVLKKK
jgi:hypothetical protein